MKNIIIVTGILFVTLMSAQSKSFEVSGVLRSAEDNTLLEAATVYLERIQDKSLVTYTISNVKGEFSLGEKVADSQLRLLISYVGFQTYEKHIDITESEINLGTIKMKVDAATLDEVVITSQAPVTIKKDTLEFNVKSFKTKKDANVEDLLKVLPGVEIDTEGVITVNGKPVDKILVNGKPFFGDDPTITTRNLTKDIIEKIQVVDTKTKGEAFSGETSDTENKTINLTIKEENNKGVFGRASAGAGTNKRYEFAGMFNRFDNDQRISVLAGGNNVNSPGFSFGEISNMFGRNSGAGRTLRGGEGITTSRNSGANFADTFGEQTDLNADYFYANSSSENKTSTKRENILPDSRFFSSSESFSLNDRESHTANVELDIEIDSTLLINIRPSFRYTANTTVFDQDEESKDANEVLTNESTSHATGDSYRNNFSNDIDITKLVGGYGAYISFEVENEIVSRNGEDFLTSETNVYGNNPSSLMRDQLTDSDSKANNLSTEINYNIPLISKLLFFNVGYNYTRNKTEDDQLTYDKDLNGDYTIFNDNLSTSFIYVDEVKEPEASLRFRNDKWSARFRTSYLFRTLENKDLLRPQFDLKRDFEAVEVRSRFRYTFSPKASAYLSYNLDNSPPELSQLQVFADVSDPLNTIVGNPNLEPTSTHNFNLGYNGFNFRDRTGFYTYVRASFINNAVVTNSIVNEDLVRLTTYANVDGNYNVRAEVSYSKRIKVDSVKSFKYRVALNANVNRNINFNNGVQYASNNTTISPRIEFTFVWKDIMEVEPSYLPSFSKNTFDLESFEDREFLYHNVRLSTTTFLPKHFEWRNEIQYNYNPNISEGFQKSAWFWNATLGYSFLKDNAIASLKAYDILNQNTNARRTANQNYIQDSQSTVLTQYFMLSFSWKFNSLGQKGEIDNNRGRPRYRH